MIIEGVDPRDIEWEVDQPVYRVYFWHQPPATRSIRQSDVMYHCEEHRVSGARDLHEVLEWVRSTARPEQTFVLYVEHVQGGSPGLFRLAGDDPTEPDRSVVLSSR